MSQSLPFVMGCCNEDIVDILGNISPVCTKCERTKLHICVQRQCEGIGAICLGCEKGNHPVHRINEIRLLFLDMKDREPFLKTDTADINRVLDNLTKIKAGIDEHVRQLENLSALCQQSILEVKRLEVLPKNGWRHELVRTIEEAQLADRIEPAFRDYFADVLKSISLYPSKQLSRSELLKAFLEQYNKVSSHGLQSHFSRIGEIECALQHHRSTKTLQDVLVEFHLKRWLTDDDFIDEVPKPQQTQTSIFNSRKAQNRGTYLACQLDSLHRSRLTEKYIECKGDRMAIFGSEAMETIRRNVKELHTSVAIKMLPPTLQSFSTLFLFVAQRPRNYQPPPILAMHRAPALMSIPKDIKHLRITLEYAAEIQLFSRLQLVPNLWYLVVIGPVPAAQLKIVLPQLRRLRVFTVLTEEGDRKSKQRSIYFEEEFRHQYKGLENNCRAYRIAMQQRVVLNRTSHLSKKLTGIQIYQILEILNPVLGQEDPPKPRTVPIPAQPRPGIFG